MNIAIIGAYPPPTGGNSVHIKRLKEALSLNGNHCSVIDLYGKENPKSPDPNIHRIGPAGVKSLLKCAAIIVKNHYDVIHFHVSAMERFLYAGYLLIRLAPRRTRKIITIHSGQFIDSFNYLSKSRKKFLAKLLSSFSHIIVVNNHQKNLISSLGIPSKRISVIPAYIPPVPKSFSEGEEILDSLCRDGRTLIVSSGYGEPLYGYHRIISAIKNNPLINRKVSLLLCLYNKFDKEYMDHLNANIHGIDSIKMVFDLNSEEFSYLLSKGQIYIRATDTDGDAVAIREAAYFNLAVIASDIVERPKYCRLFDLQNIESLSNQIIDCMSNSREEANAREDIETTASRVLNIYSSQDH